MKKSVAILLTLTTVMAMAGCKNSKDTTKNDVAGSLATISQVPSDEGQLVRLMSIKRSEGPNMLGHVGGWDGNIENIEIEKNPQAKDAFEKATSALTGMDFEAVYLLGKQIISGTNYCILCKGTATVPGANPGYYLVYVYEDLQGAASVLKIDPLLDPQNQNADWTANSGEVAFAKNQEVKDAYEKALASMILAGGENEPVAYLGLNTKDGTKYLVLCRVKAVIDDPSTELTLMTITKKSDGTAEISTDDVTFNPEYPEGSPEASETSVAADSES